MRFRVSGLGRGKFGSTERVGVWGLEPRDLVSRVLGFRVHRFSVFGLGLSFRILGFRSTISRLGTVQNERQIYGHVGIRSDSGFEVSEV